MLDATVAREAGLIDMVAQGDPREVGIAYADELLARGGRPRRTRDLAVPVPSSEAAFDGALADAYGMAHKTALAGAIRCVEAASSMPFDVAAGVEAEEFERLRVSSASRSLRHLFFAERAAAKIEDLLVDTTLRPIRTIGIVGAGTMGGGIAMAFLNAGMQVVLVDVGREPLERGLTQIRRNYDTNVSRSKLAAEQALQRMSLLRGETDDRALRECDLVIEAVFENMALKETICARLGAICKPGAIIATNTSTLDVDLLARATGRPGDVVGMHFFSPANVMRLLEIVRGASTAPDALATVMKLASSIGKVPVVSGVCYGFIGNRMAEVYMREAEFMLMEGAQPQEIDAAAEAFGMAMGPCRMLDMAGIDVGAKTVIERGKAGGLPPDPSYRVLVRKLFDLGRFGQKTGRGYYRYEGRTPVPDPELTSVCEQLAAEHGIARRPGIDREEIVERLLFPLINEGAAILDERIACRGGDIDVVWVAGYGYPEHRGGPMFTADEIGLSFIVDRLAYYASIRGNSYNYWTVSALLGREAAGGGRLSQWKTH